MADKPKKLKNKIAKNTLEQMTLQMMVANAAKLAQVPEIIVPVVDKRNPLKDEPSSEPFISKVIDEVMKNQTNSMKRSPTFRSHHQATSSEARPRTQSRMNARSSPRN